VLDVLIDSLIVTENVSVDDLLIIDKNAVFVYARKLAYGPMYDTTIKCPNCGHENSVSINLDLVTDSAFDFSGFPKGVNEFSFTFPTCKETVKYRLLSGADERSIAEELKGLSKIDKSGKSPQLTTRLKKMIVSVGDSTDRTRIKNFIDTLMSRDSLEFRRHLTSATPGIDLTLDFECEECGHVDRVAIPMGTSFFWPEVS